MTRFKVFKPVKFRPNKKQIIGFDIETTGDKNKFYCVSVVGKDFKKTFYDKKDFINFIKSSKMRNCIFAATNLLFDFFGLFFNDSETPNFLMLFRGSDLLYAKTYLKDGKFQAAPHSYPILFIDTLNYISLGVEKLGELIKKPKLKKPKCLGRLPINCQEKEELRAYNVRDAEISREALIFLYDSFEALGASPKKTIASTSMNLFRNKYLTEKYICHNKDILREMFKAYYGGRVEAITRGKIENKFLYDINSLYPYVMKNKDYPDPNTLRQNKKNTLDYIYNYEGFSDVLVSVPVAMDNPLLPLRHAGKLIFPAGTFRAWESNVELREALKYGCIIKKVYKNIYFKKTCRPFEAFVADLYAKRMEFKGQPMEKAIKIIMNSLYGKFGQKFDNKDNWIPMPDTYDEISKLNILDIKGKYARIKMDKEPAVFCFPEWAAYVTAYGRLELFRLIQQTSPDYYDTDSIITSKRMITGSEIGDLKLEMRIDEGVLVKPKLYCLKSVEEERVKAKGLGVKFIYNDFKHEFLNNPKVAYKKFIKFKEALRRNLKPNEVINIVKAVDLQDTKRSWLMPFNALETQSSKPLIMSYSRLENKFLNLSPKLEPEECSLSP